MELAAWFLTFATAAALLYAVTRALAVALRIAIGLLVVLAVVVGVQAYQRGDRADGLVTSVSRIAKNVEGAATATWDRVRPWWDAAQSEAKPERKPSRSKH